MRVLTVIHPFGDFQRGHKISDAEAIKAVLEGENAHHVVKSDEPDEMQAEEAV